VRACKQKTLPDDGAKALYDGNAEPEQCPSERVCRSNFREQQKRNAVYNFFFLSHPPSASYNVAVFFFSHSFSRVETENERSENYTLRGRFIILFIYTHTSIRLIASIASRLAPSIRYNLLKRHYPFRSCGALFSRYPINVPTDKTCIYIGSAYAEYGKRTAREYSSSLSDESRPVLLRTDVRS